MSPRARQAKSKARISAYEEMPPRRAKQAQKELEIQIPPGPRLGDVVVEAEERHQGLRRPPALRKPELSACPAGGIVGIIGPNGAGKTTLFRMITGQEQPDAGELAVGATVEIAYVDQSRDALDADKTVYEEISGGHDQLEIGKRASQLPGLLSPASISGAPTSRRRSATSPAASGTASTWPSCSRAAATCCCSTSRPTTSTSTRCARWKMRCSNFAGCAVVISHDRWFLDRIATHILAFEGDSYVVWFEGNFQEYAADYKRRKGVAVDQPHRIRYKKLVH